MFGILQDRLVKELRLKGISNIEVANRYLPEYFKRHNAQFAVMTEEAKDMHRPASEASALSEILCIKTERTVRNDNTISHDAKLYQIDAALHGKKVVMEERIDGKMLIRHNNDSFNFSEITKRPEKKQKAVRPYRTRKTIPMPIDHPFRKTKDLMLKKDQLRKERKQQVPWALL